MVIHASAFLVYVGMYIVLAAIDSSLVDPTANNYYYFSWSVDTLFGAISYSCLFLVIWHLSKTQEYARTESVNSSRTISMESG